MKQLFWIMILFAVAIGLAMVARLYSGNVFIIVEHYLIRINLHLFVLGLILAVLVIYLGIRLLFAILGTPERLSQLGVNRKSRQAMLSLNEAGLAYFEGRYQQANKAVEKVLANKQAGNNRILALMIGAHAADQSGDETLRNRYLADIAKLPEKQQLSRYLLLAESSLAQEHNESANQYLTAAAQINPRLTRLAQLQLRQALLQENALEILDKTEKLRRAGAIGEAEADTYIEQAYRHLLSQASNAKEMKACLKRIPAELQANALSLAIAQRYEQLGLYQQAVKWVNKHYPIHRNMALLAPFVDSACFLDKRGQQKAIDTAEEWLKDNPKDPQLLMYLGRLAYGLQLWGKAQGYLEASLAIKPSHHARLALAKVFDQINQSQEADEQRRLVLADLDEDIVD